ncbi:MAG: hypothetical protein JO297_04320, partial [Nitrososphaeraceae archaeon]|nr:hypothetical protein [Nitrososphaeraceae archaeon]
TAKQQQQQNNNNSKTTTTAKQQQQQNNNNNNSKTIISSTSTKTPSSANFLMAISGTTNKVLREIHMTSRPERATVNLKDNMLYTTNPDDVSVSIVDGITNNEVTTPGSLPLDIKSKAVADIVILIVISFVLIVAGLWRYISTTAKWLWPPSGVILAILSLVVLPTVVVLSEVHYDQMKLFFLQNSQYKGLEKELVILTYYNIIVQGIFIASLVFYPPYPISGFTSSQNYFKIRGFKTAVVEYEYVKKILYVAVPLFIFLTIIPIVQYAVQVLFKGYLPLIIDIRTELQQPAYKLAQAITLLIVFAGLLKIIFAVIREKFRLYFAKGCFEIVKKGSMDEVQNMSYLIKGLNSYNLYLRRQLKLEINNINTIYSKISRAPQDKKNDVTEKLSSIFLNEQLENDTLEPARYLYYFSTETEEQKPGTTTTATITATTTTPTEDKKLAEEFLIAQPIFSKIKDLAAFAAIVIPLGISVLQLFIKIPK